MEIRLANTTVRVAQDDITTLAGDAIVNARGGTSLREVVLTVRGDESEGAFTGALRALAPPMPS